MLKGSGVRLENVSRVYMRGQEEVRALDNVSLEITPGEFLAVMGASGSGKSTVLNLVAGLDTPSSGAIYLDDKPISQWQDDDLTLFRREKVGFIFQFFNLLPTLTAEENAALPLLMAGKSKKGWQPIVDKWLTRVGLENRKHHYPTELSGGQMQRVAIARALINEPRLILADEPTGALDTKTGEEILFLLKGIVEDMGATLLMVTHDPKVAAYGNRIITMKDGQILNITTAGVVAC